MWRTLGSYLVSPPPSLLAFSPKLSTLWSASAGYRVSALSGRCSLPKKRILICPCTVEQPSVKCAMVSGVFLFPQSVFLCVSPPLCTSPPSWTCASGSYVSSHICLGEATALSLASLSLAWSQPGMPLVGISVSFGTLVPVQTLMKQRMGSNSKSFHRMVWEGEQWACLWKLLPWLSLVT